MKDLHFCFHLFRYFDIVPTGLINQRCTKKVIFQIRRQSPKTVGCKGLNHFHPTPGSVSYIIDVNCEFFRCSVGIGRRKLNHPPPPHPHTFPKRPRAGGGGG